MTWRWTDRVCLPMLTASASTPPTRTTMTASRGKATPPSSHRTMPYGRRAAPKATAPRSRHPPSRPDSPTPVRGARLGPRPRATGPVNPLYRPSLPSGNSSVVSTLGSWVVLPHIGVGGVGEANMSIYCATVRGDLINSQHQQLEWESKQNHFLFFLTPP